MATLPAKAHLRVSCGNATIVMLAMLVAAWLEVEGEPARNRSAHDRGMRRHAGRGASGQAMSTAQALTRAVVALHTTSASN